MSTFLARYGHLVRGNFCFHAVVEEYTCAWLSRAIHINNEKAANSPMEIRCKDNNDHYYFQDTKNSCKLVSRK